jgi:hypothetical protein
VNPLTPPHIGRWSREHQTFHVSNRVNDWEVAGQDDREIFRDGEHDSRRCRHCNGSHLDHAWVDKELPAGPRRREMAPG